MSAPGFELDTVREIARPRTQVFDFIANTKGFKAVDPALVEVEPLGALVEGASGRFVHRRGPFAARTTWRVLRLEAPRHVVVELKGIGYAMTEDIQLEETPAGTRARFRERVWPTSLAGRILVALSGGVMRRDLRTRADLLKAVLEAEPGST